MSLALPEHTLPRRGSCWRKPSRPSPRTTPSPAEAPRDHRDPADRTAVLDAAARSSATARTRWRARSPRRPRRGQHHRPDRTDDTPEGAARIANAVTRTFLYERAAQDRRHRTGPAAPEAEADRLASSPDGASAAARRAARAHQPAQRQRGQRRLRPPAGLGGRARGRPQLAQATAQRGARPLRLALPGHPRRAGPRPALAARDRRPRELGRALDLRVLAGVPYVRGVRRRRSAVMSGVEAEAYETVRAGIELVAGREQPPRLILVTGGVHGEGKTTAAWRIGNTMARTGHKTLLDLGRPARSAPARDRRRAAGPRPVGHPGHDRLGGRPARSRDPGPLDRQVMGSDARQAQAGPAGPDHQRHQGQGPGRPGHRRRHVGVPGLRAHPGLRLRLHGRPAAAGHRRRAGTGPLRRPDDPGQPPRPPQPGQRGRPQAAARPHGRPSAGPGRDRRQGEISPVLPPSRPALDEEDERGHR